MLFFVFWFLIEGLDPTNNPVHKDGDLRGHSPITATVTHNVPDQLHVTRFDLFNEKALSKRLINISLDNTKTQC